MSDFPPNKNLSRIVVDAMGGDFAPQNEVLGAVEALKYGAGFEVYLVGKTDAIKSVLKKHNLTFDESKIIEAPQVIEMCDVPVQAIRQKPNSSLVVGANMVKSGQADALVSAGNTGAVMAASTFILGRLKGIDKPTIGALMPSISGRCAIFDSGAVVDVKPKNLVEFAIMGSVYAKEIMNIPMPRIGVLSVGEEETKGNRVSLESLKLLRRANEERNAGLNIIGNVEGGDIVKGTVDVVVCDGFVGNIVLKFGEGVLNLLKHLFKEYAEKSLFKKIKVGLFKNSLKELLSPMDYQVVGGVPLLGVKGITIIGHGKSTPLAIRNMIFRAHEMHQRELLMKMGSAIDIINIGSLTEGLE